MIRSPSLEKVIIDAIESRVASIHTLLPGKVVKVDVTKGKCDVQPLLQRLKIDGTVATLPVITNCPIAFYRAGNAAVYLPVAVGNLVEIRFCERSLDTWLAKGGTVDPADARKHNLSDALVYPGLYDFTNPPVGADPANLVMVNSTAKVTLKPSGEIDLTNATGTLKMTSDGKFNLTGASDELLQTISDLIDKLIALLVVDPITGYQGLSPDTVSNLTAVKARITGLKA